jgi:hypothetical protein
MLRNGIIFLGNWLISTVYQGLSAPFIESNVAVVSGGEQYRSLLITLFPGRALIVGRRIES